MSVASVPRVMARRSLAERAVRLGYAPLLLFAANGVVVWLVAQGAPKVALAAVLCSVLGLSFAAERFLPYEPAWNRSRGDARRDVAHALVNEVSMLPALWLLPALVGAVGIEGAWPRSWPLGLQVILAVAVLDAGVTLGHAASHRIRTLWRFHAVHHSVTRFYGLNGLMKHPFHQAFELAAGTAPLVVLGLPPEVATALVSCTAVQLLLQHSNVDYTVGPLRHLLAVNEVHRFHHLKWPKVGDVNFGLFTCLWDHVLGTYRYDAGRRFDSSVLGIAAEPDYPVGYLAQLVRPFRVARDG